jgi:hypothetical protein
LKEIQKSDLVPKPNFVLTSSPDKFQVVWKVDDITLEDAEALLHALAREFGGDPAATAATRVLRLPGFANKKYDADFHVEAERHSTDTYHLGDFKLHIDGQDSPRQNYHARMKRQSTAKDSVSPSVIGHSPNARSLGATIQKISCNALRNIGQRTSRTPCIMRASRFKKLKRRPSGRNRKPYRPKVSNQRATTIR